MSGANNNDDLEMDPVFMTLATALQQGTSGAITSAFSIITPAQLSMFAAAIGPLGVANFIPAFFEATGNNVTSGLLTAVNHALLGASTEAASASYVKVDEAASAARDL